MTYIKRGEGGAAASSAAAARKRKAGGKGNNSSSSGPSSAVGAVQARVKAQFLRGYSELRHAGLVRPIRRKGADAVELCVADVTRFW